jgi:integrase
MFADYRDRRLETVKPATVIKELGLFRNALNVARRDWGFHMAHNPVELVTKPKVGVGRDRRLNRGEFERLEQALTDTRNPFVGPAIKFAIETGLRRGELLGLLWKDIDLRTRTASVRESKNGHPRAIPLTDGAVSILLALTQQHEQVFPITANALRLSWNRLRERAALPDLRIHDLRHEAISRFAEMGLSTIELAIISGHRDPRMLFRYAHLRPADLARKLKGRVWDY